MQKNIWLTDPEEHDFPAAFDFLTLLYTDKIAGEIIEKLKQAKTITKKAKDVLRASQLPLLPKENIHVKQNLKKVDKGIKLSPVLLVRGEKLIVADGYHRVCAIYYLSEDQEVPCRITDKSV